MSNILVGADPGAKGAFAKLDPVNYTIELFDMPTHTFKKGQKTKTVIDHVGIGDILNDDRIFQLYLEEVSARPGEGVVSSFSFGRNFGTVLGACGAFSIPVNLIRPAVWKQTLKVPADKSAARYRASQLFPECSKAWTRVKDDGRAEATLIAFYGFCALGFRLEQKFKLIGELAEA